MVTNLVLSTNMYQVQTQWDLKDTLCKCKEVGVFVAWYNNQRRIPI